MIQDSSGNDPIYGRYYINGHWGYFSSTDQWGAYFTPPIYLEVLPFEHQEEFARVRTEAGIADLTGYILLEPGQYEKVSFKQFPDTNCINETTYFFCEKDEKIQTITLDELKKLKYEDS